MKTKKAPLCKGSWQTEGLTEGLVLAVTAGSLSSLHQISFGLPPLMPCIKGGKTGRWVCEANTEGM